MHYFSVNAVLLDIVYLNSELIGIRLSGGG